MPYGTRPSQAIVPVTPANGLASNAPDGLALKLSGELLGPACCNSSCPKNGRTRKEFRALGRRSVPTLTPGAMAWPKWHSAEPSHRVRIAHHRARHERAPIGTTELEIRQAGEIESLAAKAAELDALTTEVTARDTLRLSPEQRRSVAAAAAAPTAPPTSLAGTLTRPVDGGAFADLRVSDDGPPRPAAKADAWLDAGAGGVP